MPKDEVLIAMERKRYHERLLRLVHWQSMQMVLPQMQTKTV